MGQAGLHSIEVTATKNLAKRLQFVGGFHRQWQHQAGTWNPTDPARFIQPDAYRNDKLIYMARGVDDTDSYRLFAFGPSWQEYSRFAPAAHGSRLSDSWFRRELHATSRSMAGPHSHETRGYRSRRHPLRSGHHPGRWRLSIKPACDDDSHQVPTRGEGQEQYQADPVRVLNLKVGKKLRFDDRREVEMSANIFNLANGNGHWQYDYANASQEFNPASCGCSAVRRRGRFN